MSWVAAATVSSALSLGGAVIGADASKDAARIQADSANNATQAQLQMFNTANAELQPYRDFGAAALPTLRTMLGLSGGDTNSSTFGTLTKPFTFDPNTDPGYQFRLGEGTKAIENSAAAGGMQLSGATLKELMRYGQDYASGELNAGFNRDLQTKNQLYSMLTGAAGIGSGATNTSVNAGMNTGNAIAANTIGAGNAAAAGTVGSANAWSNAFGNIGNNAMNAYTLRTIMGNSTNPIMAGSSLAPVGPGPG